MRLIDADALKEAFEKVYPSATNEMGGAVNKRIYDIIDNIPTITSLHDCELTQFGECTYMETGCSDCAVKQRIRNALNKPDYSSEWIDGYNHAVDQVFKELNYLVKNHVLEELRKSVNLKR